GWCSSAAGGFLGRRFPTAHRRPRRFRQRRAAAGWGLRGGGGAFVALLATTAWKSKRDVASAGANGTDLQGCRRVDRRRKRAGEGDQSPRPVNRAIGRGRRTGGLRRALRSESRR